MTTGPRVSGWGETCPVGPTYQAEHALGARAALCRRLAVDASRALTTRDVLRIERECFG